MQVMCIDALGERRVWIVFSIRPTSENIADATKDVAAVIKRHDLKSFRERRARFQINDRECVSADGHGKGVELNQLALLVAKNPAAARNRHLQKTFRHAPARPCLFKAE